MLGKTVPDLRVPAMTRPTPVTMYTPSIKNSTGSLGFLKYPLMSILEVRRLKNSLSLGIPSPVTLEIVKIGQTLSEAKL